MSTAPYRDVQRGHRIWQKLFEVVAFSIEGALHRDLDLEAFTCVRRRGFPGSQPISTPLVQPTGSHRHRSQRRQQEVVRTEDHRQDESNRERDDHGDPGRGGRARRSRHIGSPKRRDRRAARTPAAHSDLEVTFSERVDGARARRRAEQTDLGVAQ